MRTAFLLSVLALTTVFAGCAGSGGKAGATDGPSSVVEASGEPIPDAGALRVQVVDDSVAAIEGADVAIVELSLQARTDADGQAVFNNLAPGTYTVAAQKLGYTSVVKKHEVVPNEEATITLNLVAIAIAEPFPEVLGPFQGYFDCRLGIALQTGACVPLAAANGNDKSAFEFTMYNETIAWVGEMKWGQGSFATSQQLRMSFSYNERDSTHWFCTNTSGSPVRWTYTIEEGCLAQPYCGIGETQGTGGSAPSEPSADLTLLVYVNTPFSCPNAGEPTPDTNNLHPVELALQQKFEIWVTQFQGMMPPVDYSALPDQ